MQSNNLLRAGCKFVLLLAWTGTLDLRDKRWQLHDFHTPLVN